MFTVLVFPRISMVFTRLHAQFEIPGCVRDLRQSDCAADVMQL